MLIEFSVENYMCFKNETTFSFEAMADLNESKIFNPESRRLLDGVADPETGEPIMINTVNAIYGKNAAGKSTLLRAILKAFELIMGSAKLNEDDDFGIDYEDENQTPKFRLKFSPNLSSLFEYSFSLQGIGNDATILSEKLYNLTTANLVFERNQREIIFNLPAFETHNEDYLRRSIRRNHLILSNTTVSYFEALRTTFSAGHSQMIDVVGGLKLDSLSYDFFADSSKTIKEIALHPHIKDPLIRMLQESDVNIKDYYFENNHDTKNKVLFFVDKAGVNRPFSKQSDGTKKYFILLFFVHLNVLRNGGMFIVDELEKALHPKLALHLINIFKNKKTNPNGARLLFTSHDVGFMHQSILNGDQVWFIDRNDETQETELFAAADVEGFEPVYLQSDYMQGLYGAVPTTANENK
jgi:AAA15 family ATPase/GTPase